MTEIIVTVTTLAIVIINFAFNAHKNEKALSVIVSKLSNDDLIRLQNCENSTLKRAIQQEIEIRTKEEGCCAGCTWKSTLRWTERH